MIDLTTLSKNELIKEFDVIISEWQICLNAMQPYKNQLGELETERKKSYSTAAKRTGFFRLQDEIELVKLSV